MAILEVAIGVVFFIVTLSLLTSTVAEWWSRKQDKRSALLEDGIRLLLGGERRLTKVDGGLVGEPGNYGVKLVSVVRKLFAMDPPPAKSTPPATGAPSAAASNAFLESVLAHPLIRTRGMEKEEFPQAIAPKDFARAVLAVAGVDPAAGGTTDLSAVLAKIEEPRIRQALMALLTGTQTTLEDFLARIATWFESAMDETTKLYRRAMELVVRWFAFVIVLALNADALVLIDVLWKDPALRATLVAAAEKLDESAPTGLELDEIITRAREDLAPFPLGWPSCSEWDSDPRGLPAERGLIVGVLMKLAGWAITILAVSLGAPFWFDLLRQLISLRRGEREPAAPPQPAAAAGK